MSGRDAVLGVGGPLAAAPADELIRDAFGAELAQQRALAADVGLADLAHALELVASGAVTAHAGAGLVRGLLALEAQPADFTLDPALGDLYTNREAWLGEHGYAAGLLGTGRARREAITTAYALVARKRTLALSRALIDAARALADAAERHARSMMPDYTYLQAGQPTSFGHYLLGFAYPMLRDLERAGALFAHFDRSPAGVGGTNGSTFALDRERIAASLGFAGIVTHARDAMWQADGAIEALSVACAASVNLDRLAEDLAIFATAEFGFVELADAHSRASKLMPQKKNPFALGYVRAVANRTIGVAAGIAAAARTPSGQMDNRLDAYGEVPAALERVAGAAALMAAVVRDLTFDATAARAALARGHAYASDLAELVMREADLEYRAAHELVARVVRERERARGGNGTSLTAALDAAARELLGRPLEIGKAALDAVLDPAAALERRCGVGGAAPDAVAAMLADVRERVAAFAASDEQAAERIARAERDVLDRARALAEAG